MLLKNCYLTFTKLTPQCTANSAFVSNFSIKQFTFWCFLYSLQICILPPIPKRSASRWIVRTAESMSAKCPGAEPRSMFHSGLDKTSKRHQMLNHFQLLFNRVDHAPTLNVSKTVFQVWTWILCLKMLCLILCAWNIVFLRHFINMWHLWHGRATVN